MVIEPGRMGQLTLRLDAGDKVDGKMTVIPAGINFIVEDPYGVILLNVGPVTEKVFTFKAGTSGNYQLLFVDNSTSSLPGRVVLVQIQHPGPGQFPNFAGTYVPVEPRGAKTVSAVLVAGQGLKASFGIQGGQQDLEFSVRDPHSSTVVPQGKIYGSSSFTLTAAMSGTYQLCFDNSTSSYATKLVSLELFTNPAGTWQSWWGTPVKLAFATSPAGAMAGSAFTSQPVVTLLDSTGNTATASSAAVTVAISPGTGTSGAMLLGTTTVSAVNGVATFSGLGISLAGSGYTLAATSGGLFPTTSSAFNVSSGSNPAQQLAKFSLEVVVMPAAGGSVTLSPSDGTYVGGTTVTLRATPAPGYKFVGWGGNLLGPMTPINIIMDSNKRVTASFVPLGW